MVEVSCDPSTREGREEDEKLKVVCPQLHSEGIGWVGGRKVQSRRKGRGEGGREDLDELCWPGSFNFRLGIALFPPIW